MDYVKELTEIINSPFSSEAKKEMAKTHLKTLRRFGLDEPFVKAEADEFLQTKTVVKLPEERGGQIFAIMA